MSQDAELKLILNELVFVLENFSKEELKNLGYNNNEIDCLDKFSILFGKSDYVSGRVLKRK